MKDIDQILKDIAESWGYDSFADYCKTGLSENQIRILASDAVELALSERAEKN